MNVPDVPGAPGQQRQRGELGPAQRHKKEHRRAANENDHRQGNGFGTPGNAAAGFPIFDDGTKLVTVDQPVVCSGRRFGKAARREQNQGGCGEQGEDNAENCRSQKENTKNKPQLHAIKVTQIYIDLQRILIDFCHKKWVMIVVVKKREA